MIERFRSGAGGLRPTPAWPVGMRGTAAAPAGGVAYAGPGEDRVCAWHDCGGLVPVSRCAEHGDAVELVVSEWHPGGGTRCTSLDFRFGRLRRKGAAPA